MELRGICMVGSKVLIDACDASPGYRILGAVLIIYNSINQYIFIIIMSKSVLSIDNYGWYQQNNCFGYNQGTDQTAFPAL